MPQTFDREAWRFFHAEAGVCTPGRAAVTAADLARAERVAHERGWDVAWIDDPEPWDCSDGCRPDTVECAALYELVLDDDGWPDGDPVVLASLGSIGDATPAYRRVIAAELALEALARVPSPVAPGAAPDSANEFWTNFEIPAGAKTTEACVVLVGTV